MHWKTARAFIRKEDCKLISHVYYGAHLRFPVCDSVIELSGPRGENLGTVGVPEPVVDEASIEQMLAQSSLPLTGWVPGYEHSHSPYNDRKIYHAILSVMRMFDRSVTVTELRDKFEVDDRLFHMHLANMTEDIQGLVRVGEDELRLTSWREAIEASRRLIEQTAPRHGGDIFQPKAHLRLTDSYTGCDWMVQYSSKNGWWLFQLASPYTSVRGDESVIDSQISKYGIPLGWAATYGENESWHKRAYEELRASMQQG